MNQLADISFFNSLQSQSYPSCLISNSAICPIVFNADSPIITQIQQKLDDAKQVVRFADVLTKLNSAGINDSSTYGLVKKNTNNAINEIAKALLRGNVDFYKLSSATQKDIISIAKSGLLDLIKVGNLNLGLTDVARKALGLYIEQPKQDQVVSEEYIDDDSVDQKTLISKVLDSAINIKDKIVYIAKITGKPASMIGDWIEKQESERNRARFEYGKRRGEWIKDNIDDAGLMNIDYFTDGKRFVTGKKLRMLLVNDFITVDEAQKIKENSAAHFKKLIAFFMNYPQDHTFKISKDSGSYSGSEIAKMLQDNTLTVKSTTKIKKYLEKNK